MKTIGWKETLELVTLNVPEVQAKVDTGAKTSVLHCVHIEDFRDKGAHYVRFVPFGHEHTPTNKQDSFILPCKKQMTIKNSFGQEECRFVVTIQVKLFEQEYEMELSLRDRSKMEYPMLIGRNFIRGKFLVDVSRSNLSKKHISKENS
ncbi:ATP-dependent zinc protease family protein [Olivibacter sitiensis]|uniref:ATP-dependent zinc protease family protein n=1 Tax=Olivibacter sitiensis TaxID=376470 RepID=UPI000402BE33|nr:ATP-dependent zinc protease [Olivibacter sitiensis]